MELAKNPLALGFAGGTVGAAAVLLTAFVIVPAVTAPAATPAPPCDPHAQSAPPEPYTPFPPEPWEASPPSDPFDPNTLVFVVYELNTGKIVSATWISSSEPQSGQGVSSDGSVSMVPLSGTPAWMAPYRIDPESGTLLAPNQNAVNATTDPNRDGLLESFMCIGEGDLPWKVDPWSARLVPA